MTATVVVVLNAALGVRQMGRQGARHPPVRTYVLSATAGAVLMPAGLLAVVLANIRSLLNPQHSFPPLPCCGAMSVKIAWSAKPCDVQWLNLPCNLVYLPIMTGFFAYFYSINFLAFDRLYNVLSIDADGAITTPSTRASRAFLRTFQGPSFIFIVSSVPVHLVLEVMTPGRWVGSIWTFAFLLEAVRYVLSDILTVLTLFLATRLWNIEHDGL